MKHTSTGGSIYWGAQCPDPGVIWVEFWVLSPLQYPHRQYLGPEELSTAALPSYFEHWLELLVDPWRGCMSLQRCGNGVHCLSVCGVQCPCTRPICSQAHRWVSATSSVLLLLQPRRHGDSCTCPHHRRPLSRDIVTVHRYSRPWRLNTFIIIIIISSSSSRSGHLHQRSHIRPLPPQPASMKVRSLSQSFTRPLPTRCSRKLIAQSLMHRHFAIVCSRIMRFFTVLRN